MNESEKRQRIRERKKEALRERIEGGADAEGGPADTETTPTEPVAITGRDHLDRFVSDHGVALVDCYADWCGPCQMLEPTIESLAADSDAAVATVDVDAHPGLAGALGVRGVPTLLLYADGEPVERRSGVQDEATLKSLIDRYT